MHIQILYDFNLCVIKIITLRSGLNCVGVLGSLEDVEGTCQRRDTKYTAELGCCTLIVCVE
jgi:hypothetical protein